MSEEHRQDSTDYRIDPKYEIETQENRDFLHDQAMSLLSFGTRFPSEEGGAYYLGDDGTPWKERPRETWITARMAHVYALGEFLGFEGSHALAASALKGLRTQLYDKEDGGWYAGVMADGTPLENQHCYAHAFVILAASSAVLAGHEGSRELLDQALALYDERFWNEEEGLSADLWDTQKKELDDYRGLNANMHTVEAFLAAADVLKDEKYRVRAGRIIDRVLDWTRENSWRIPEHYSSRWEPDFDCSKDRPDDPFKPYGATPGHGIEWSRLIIQWAVSTYPGDEVSDVSAEALPYIQAAENLFDRAVDDAWCADGAPGICYTTDWDGKPIVHDRMHWTLAEAINTAATLYRVTGKAEYADRYAEFMEYLDAAVLDHKNGSWYHQLDLHNQPMDTVWPGKPDLYHALQAMLIPYCRVGESIAPAVKNGDVSRPTDRT